MTEVKILIEGYTNADSVISNGEEKSCATITLIKDKSINIVVDPGILENQKILIDTLRKEGMDINDIHYVFLTHSHIDHYRNIGMFPSAKTLEFFGLWDKNTVENWQEQFTENIRIVKTPGHDRTGLTFLVKTEKGIVAICGDVFWKENGPINDPYASEIDLLKESRKKVLKLADYVIPGHAGIYKIKK